jgi:hypothetical protein
MPVGMAIGAALRMRQYRACLMIGASALAAATLSSAARADGAPPKWLPNVSVSAQGGDDVSGAKVTEFDPIWQDLNSLLYARLGFGTLASDNMIASGGLGYRAQASDGWIMGLYGGFDFTKTRYSHSFTQASLGAEAMSANWDLRVNGYVTLDQQLKDIPGSSGLFLQGTQIALLKGQIAAYSGVDGEVGYRVYNTDDIDVRLFAGGFTFGSGPARHSSMGQSFKVGPQVIAGPMGRAEIELYNLHRFGVDLFGSQSRLTLSGEVSHDDVRGTTGYAGVSLQIPIGGPDSDEDQDELDRRMVDPVRRQDYVLTEKTLGAPEPVIISNGHITSQPTNTVYYVDNTTGAGTYADPTTLHDATARGPVNQFVVLTDRQGPVNASGVTVKSGETVVGPGTFTVRGTISGRSFTHDFAPHSGPVTVTSSDPDVITLQNNVNLYGFTIAGPFTNAIYGHNVTGVHLSGLTISGGGTGQNGIYFHDDDGTSTNVSVDNSTMTGITQDGIKLAFDNATGTTADATANLTALTVTAGHNGVALDSTISGGSQETTYLGVHNSTLSGGSMGLSATGSATVGASLSQIVVVDPTHITGGDFGIVVNGTSYGGTLDQSIALDQVYVIGTQFGGIVIGAESENNGTVLQSVTMTQVSTSGGNYGIELSVGASSGHATQTTLMSQVTASDAVYDNIRLSAGANSGGIAHQYTTLQNSTLTGAHNDNLFATTYADTSGVTQQNVTLTNFTASGAYYDNIHLSVSADGATANQIAALTNVTVTGAHYYNIDAHAYSVGGGTASQTLTLNGVTATGAQYGNIQITAYGGLGGTVNQSATLTNVTASGAQYENIYFGAYAYGGTVHAYAMLTNVTANGSVQGDGLEARAGGYTGTVLQTLDIAQLTANANHRDGVDLAAAGGNATVTQQVTIGIAYTEHNSRDGIYLSAFAGAAGATVQTAHIDHATAIYNGYGLQIAASGFGYAGSYGHATQSVFITNGVFSHNTRNGVDVHGFASGGAVVYSTVSISNSQADNNAASGISVFTYAGSGAAVYSTVSIGTSHVDGNVASGISVVSQANDGGYVYQLASLTGAAGNLASADGNGLDGVHAQSISYGGTVQQYVYVTQASATGNHRDGVYARADARNSATPSYILQYVGVDTAAIAHSGSYGVQVIGTAHGAHSTALQYAYVINSQLTTSYAAGFGAEGIAYTGGTTAQYSSFAGDTIANNQRQGIVIRGTATGASSLAAEALVFGPSGTPVSNITGNGTDGIYIVAQASNGGRAEQLAVIYGVNASYNQRDGVEILNVADQGGYIGQQVIAAYSTLDHNQGNGIEIRNSFYFGGALYQDVFVDHNDVSHNAGTGLSLVSQMFTERGGHFYQAYQYTTLHLTGGTFTYNGGNGIDTRSHIYSSAAAPAVFDGYAYQIQRTVITGVTADHNTGAGLYVVNSTSGRYGLSANYVTLGTSTFNHNGAGAGFLSIDSYGAGGYGRSLQLVAITASDFSYNTQDGLVLQANASGSQGDAEQQVHVNGSTFTHNGADGIHIYASAVNGTYAAGHPCTIVYSPASGCAFVLQSVFVNSSHLDNNTGNGVFVGTYANNYGAIYGAAGRPHAPTLKLYGSTASYNGARGIDMSNHVTGHSYLYQYVGATDSVFGHNHSDGIYASSYAGGASTALQRHLVYGYHTIAGVSYNAGNGFKSTIEALGGSYVREVNVLEHADFSHNGGFGVDGAVAYADGTSTGLQINAAYFNTINNNGDGVGLYSIGPGAQQISYIGSNEIGNNAFVGAYGEANFAAFQYIDIYALGNNVHNNGTNYLFNSFGGSTQILH